MTRGFTLQHCQDDIVLIRFHDLTPEIAAEWEQVVTQLYWEAMQQGQHLRILYDMRDISIPARDACNAIIRSTHKLPEDFRRSNAVLTMPYTLGLMEREVRRLPRRSATTVRLFLTEHEALGWLEGRHAAQAV